MDGVVRVKPLMTDEKGNFKFGSVRHATLWGVDSMHSGDRDPPIFWAFFALIRSRKQAVFILGRAAVSSHLFARRRAAASDSPDRTD